MKNVLGVCCLLFSMSIFSAEKKEEVSREPASSPEIKGYTLDTTGPVVKSMKINKSSYGLKDSIVFTFEVEEQQPTLEYISLDIVSSDEYRLNVGTRKVTNLVQKKVTKIAGNKNLYTYELTVKNPFSQIMAIDSDKEFTVRSVDLYDGYTPSYLLSSRPTDKDVKDLCYEKVIGKTFMRSYPYGTYREVRDLNKTEKVASAICEKAFKITGNKIGEDGKYLQAISCYSSDFGHGTPDFQYVMSSMCGGVSNLDVIKFTLKP